MVLDIYGQKGDDGYFNECIEKISRLDNICFKGSIKETTVVETIREYDILCLCSTFSEMSPLVIQEAFAAGIPVLASNVYGNAEQIVNGENGLLFKYNDVVSLKIAISKLIAEPDLLSKLKANIKPPLSFEVVKNEYKKLYKGLLNAK